MARVWSSAAARPAGRVAWAAVLAGALAARRLRRIEQPVAAAQGEPAASAAPAIGPSRAYAARATAGRAARWRNPHRHRTRQGRPDPAHDRGGAGRRGGAEHAQRRRAGARRISRAPTSPSSSRTTAARRKARRRPRSRPWRRAPSSSSARSLPAPSRRRGRWRASAAEPSSASRPMRASPARASIS